MAVIAADNPPAGYSTLKPTESSPRVYVQDARSKTNALNWNYDSPAPGPSAYWAR